MARTALSLRTLAIAAGVSISLALANPASAIDLHPIQQPSWAELTAQQREVLTPLSGEWDKLESYRRKKWLGIAQRYPSMTPDEQKHVQHNMQAWVKLTPAQRQQAREQFKKNLQKAPPEAIKQKWQEYSELPDAEKERLRKQAMHKAQPKSSAGKSLPLTKPGIIKATPATSAPLAPIVPPAKPGVPTASSVPAQAAIPASQPVSPQPSQ